MPESPRRIANILPTLAVVASLASPSSAGEPLRVRVLTYNINHGEGTDSRVDLDRITEAIRAAEPDVVALQEVDRGMARSGRVDQARLLSGRLRMARAFGGNFEFLGGEFGNAILSRLPVAEARNHRLPSAPGGEPRGALEATFVPEGGPAFRVISTQLDHRRDDRGRRLAADRLAALADIPDAPPAILAGDLNARSTDPALGVLAAGWRPTAGQPLPTVPAGAPTVDLDRILVTPPDRWRVVEVRVLDEPAASDHRPVLAVLECLPGPADSPAPADAPASDADPGP